MAHVSGSWGGGGHYTGHRVMMASVKTDWTAMRRPRGRCPDDATGFYRHLPRPGTRRSLNLSDVTANGEAARFSIMP